MQYHDQNKPNDRSGWVRVSRYAALAALTTATVLGFHINPTNAQSTQADYTRSGTVGVRSHLGDGRFVPFDRACNRFESITGFVEGSAGHIEWATFRCQELVRSGGYRVLGGQNGISHRVGAASSRVRQNGAPACLPNQVPIGLRVSMGMRPTMATFICGEVQANGEVHRRGYAAMPAHTNYQHQNDRDLSCEPGQVLKGLYGTTHQPSDGSGRNYVVELGVVCGPPRTRTRPDSKGAAAKAGPRGGTVGAKASQRP